MATTQGTYDRIQEARREDDPHLPQGVWQATLKKANWGAVRDICLEALETRSKDLQLAVWLLEAWLHLEGFAGVSRGLTLIIGLCERFWETLYPTLAGDDQDARLAPVAWLNEKLSLQLKQIPLTQPRTGDVLPYCWADWETACHLDHVAKKAPHAVQGAAAEGRVTQAKLLESVMLSPTSLYVALAEELCDTMDATVALECLLDAHCGPKAPSLCQFKETLAPIQRLVHDILQERQADEDVYTVPVAHGPDTDLVSEGGPPEADDVSDGGPIRSRAEAYRRLSEAADYLLRTEPHSPTPYLVKRAVSWGGMPLTELLQEVVRDERDLSEIFTLLGVMKSHAERR